MLATTTTGTISLSVWTLVIITMTSTAFGMLVILLPSLLWGGRGEQKPSQPKAPNQGSASRSATVRQGSDASKVPSSRSSAVSTPAAVSPAVRKVTSPVSITRAGLAEVTKRAGQRQSFKISELANILGVVPSTITLWVGRGYLVSMVMPDKTRWVSANSVVSLLNRLGIEPTDVAEASEPEPEEYIEPEPIAPESIEELEPNPTEDERIEAAQSVRAEIKRVGKAEPAVDREWRGANPQMYRYYVTGMREPFPSLRTAMLAAKMKLPTDGKIFWDRLSSDQKARIKRERIRR